jgi:2-amino-4-hydroxy-6-hydroxymethyldihydropteridine diphosphokinase
MDAEPESYCFVSFGSNLGDRAGYLDGGRRALESLADAKLCAASSVYETVAIGPGEQGAYLNAVVAIEWTGSADSLLEALLAIERSLGRRREQEGQRWGPRTLDLDLLLFRQECIDAPGLVVPHPRLHERGFVLEPLCEIAPDLRHPRLGEVLSTFRDAQPDRGELARFEGKIDWRPVGVAYQA